ncbi:hypothetical protein EX461_24310, partial [Vibrio parahaemolyticus]|nr:hypothetical protein [Vibrio parahaemolyticus]
MFETNFIQFMKLFSEIPIYSFYIPESAPSTAFCFENAGFGCEHFYDYKIESRTIKLTLSTKNISEIFDDSKLTKYIESTEKVGEIEMLKTRILNFNDNFNH